MGTSRPTERCYVCGGGLRTGALGFECRRCGLLYGSTYARMDANRPLLDSVNFLRQKLVRLRGSVLNLIDIIIPPEESPNVKQANRKRRG